MGKQPPPKETSLYRRTDEVLHYLWDPIGVAGIPAARDEYDSYLPTVLSLLNKGAEEREIAMYLQGVARDDMGLKGNPTHSLEIAKILVEHRAWLAEHPDESS